jgi:hypothetical protein
MSNLEVVEMSMEVVNAVITGIGFQNPMEKLYELWPSIAEAISINAVPHLVGKASAEGLDMNVVLFTEPRELIFDDEEGRKFIVPLDPREGVEGAYIRLIKALGAIQ